jgi:hypothetical protein
MLWIRVILNAGLSKGMGGKYIFFHGGYVPAAADFLSGGIESAVAGNHFPVKHRIVDAPKDWSYSTFHRYVEKGMYSPDWGATPTEIRADIGGE